MRIADAGAAPQTNAELHALMKGMVGTAHGKVLDALIAAYPSAIGREALGEQIGIALTGGYGQRVVGELKTLGAITYPTRGTVRAADIMFVEA